MRLGRYFTMEEFVVSRTAARRGINNAPGEGEMSNIAFLVLTALEPIRRVLSRHYGKDVPLFITSGFRCVALNQAVSGVADSEHISGLAADFAPVGLPAGATIAEVAKLITQSDEVVFDQIILYPDERRYHVGVRLINPRCEVLMETAPGRYEVWP